MASIVPFAWTPPNSKPAKGPRGRPARAVTFDCEMGYTVYGLELIRLTAVSWPQGDKLVDVLVRPKGTILDLNSRFSGVWPEAFVAAIPYDLAPVEPPGSERLDVTPKNNAPAAAAVPPLPIVDSPEAARDLLCSFLTPETPLIGHALENDLNSVRLCHTCIIDTIVLYPHPRGLPIRYGLKMLTKKWLQRDIQMGGAMGHDSLEDARATGDLVRYKVGTVWKGLAKDGWTIQDNQLMPPLPTGLPPPPGGDDETSQPRVLGSGAKSGVKRQRIQVDQ